MPADYRAFAEQVKRLDAALAALRPAAANVGLSPPDGEEWFELLRNKLLPQVDLPPFLVAAIVGGTNIGKSVIFNHLAGEVASAVSPLAAGTKHPVCLVPAGADDPELLARLFEPFRLHAWQSAGDPLREAPENRL
jgi:branched-subunit amino acid aminotransferase/4-amino-4-deoxychorismate lyase